MIRTVPTGDIGLDAILGGGWRLIERLPARESATVVIRGGPGAGKTLLAVDVALALAGALSGDVVVACVELLPTEYFAQIEAGRAELVQCEPPRVIMLTQTIPLSPAESPRIFCGLLPELIGPEPDLVAALETLHRDVTVLNGEPMVFVVDSLIAGYGLGPTSPRQNVDALMKFAAQEGLGLVLCEEATDDTPSVWDFAADTLLVLEQQRTGERQILVRKHRYGASATGAHQLEIRGWGQPRVYPRLDAWRGVNRIMSTLGAHGWRFRNGYPHPHLRWIDGLGLKLAEPRDYRSSFALVSALNLALVRKLAFGLLPVGAQTKRDVVIDFDPLRFDVDGCSSSNLNLRYIPVAAGVNAAICEVVEYLGGCLFSEPTRRIVIGDLGAVASLADQALWAEGIGMIAALVAESGWGIPVIAYNSNSQGVAGPRDLAALRWRADLVVEAGDGIGTITSRANGTIDTFHVIGETLADPWPTEIAHLAQLPNSVRDRRFSS